MSNKKERDIWLEILLAALKGGNASNYAISIADKCLATFKTKFSETRKNE